MIKLTMEEYLEIHDECGVDVSEKDAIKGLKICNELAESGERIQGKYIATASDWVRFYAEQVAAENDADYQAYRKFHSDAYGDD